MQQQSTTRSRLNYCCESLHLRCFLGSYQYLCTVFTVSMRHFSLIVTVIHGINEHGTLNIGSAGKTNKIITTYGFNSLKFQFTEVVWKFTIFFLISAEQIWPVNLIGYCFWFQVIIPCLDKVVAKENLSVVFLNSCWYQHKPIVKSYVKRFI